MKLNKISLANSLATFMVVAYIVCYFFVVLLPTLSREIYASWFHGLDINAVWLGQSTNFVLGLVTSTAAAWISGWFVAWLYNKFSK